MRLQEKKNDGMTLVELLVVIAILGIFMAIAVPSVIQSVRVTSQMRNMTERYPNARKALFRMSDMMRRTYPAALESGVPFVGRNASFETGGVMIPADELSFPVMDTGYSHVRSVQEVSYRLDLTPEKGETLKGLVEHRLFVGAGSETGIHETVAGRIMGLDFRYLDDSVEPAAWTEEWPPTSEKKADSLPAAVRITIFVLGDISPRPKSFTTIVNIPSRRENI